MSLIERLFGLVDDNVSPIDTVTKAVFGKTPGDVIDDIQGITSNLPTISDITNGLPSLSEIVSGLPSLSQIVNGLPSLSQITSNLPSLSQITSNIVSSFSANIIEPVTDWIEDLVDAKLSFSFFEDLWDLLYEDVSDWFTTKINAILGGLRS